MRLECAHEAFKIYARAVWQLPMLTFLASIDEQENAPRGSAISQVVTKQLVLEPLEELGPTPLVCDLEFRRNWP
jgi:hypothetical protein